MRSTQYDAPADQPVATTISLPSTPARPGRSDPMRYVRILRRVRMSAAEGWRLEGDIYKQGARLDRPRLPDPLVALELAGAVKIGHGHNRSEYLYILWRWDGAWREIARAISAAWDWSWQLGPIARKLLIGDTPREQQIRDLVDDVLFRFGTAIDDIDDPEVRKMVCEGVYERLAAGSVAA